LPRMIKMSEIDNLKKAILDDYPRLGEDDKFRFACRPGVPCFNQCCADVNIFLTPYDVLRLKNRLKMDSDDFLDKYTLLPIEEHQNYPVVMLKMQDNPTKSCHLVTEGGCSVYSDRPWACRYYPVGLASPKEGESPADQDFYFLLKEDVCKGFEENREWSVREWRTDQGVDKYDEFGRLFKEITLHDYFQSQKQLDPMKMEMFHTACYNLDKFRRFIQESSFLQRFDLEPGLVEKILADDEALLRFGMQWLKFALFGDTTMKVKASSLR
jgi:Fe-S-cluster containining protein